MSARVITLRVLALGGLAVSAWLLLETLAPGGAGCGHGGCDAVLRSTWARPLGIPLPTAGLLLFASLLGLSLAPGRLPARCLWALALAGAVGGTGLILVQGLVLQQFCPFCLVADTSAL